MRGEEEMQEHARVPESAHVDPGFTVAVAEALERVDREIAAGKAEASGVPRVWECEGCGEEVAFPNEECGCCGCEIPEHLRVQVAAAATPAAAPARAKDEDVSTCVDVTQLLSAAGVAAAAEAPTAERAQSAETAEDEGADFTKEFIRDLDLAATGVAASPGDQLYFCHFCRGSVAARFMRDHLEGHIALAKVEDAELLKQARREMEVIIGDEVSQVVCDELLAEWGVLDDPLGDDARGKAHLKDKKKDAGKGKGKKKANETRNSRVLVVDRHGHARPDKDRVSPHTRQLEDAKPVAASSSSADGSPSVMAAGDEAADPPTATTESVLAGAGSMSALVDTLKGLRTAKALQLKEVAQYLEEIERELERGAPPLPTGMPPHAQQQAEQQLREVRQQARAEAEWRRHDPTAHIARSNTVPYDPSQYCNQNAVMHMYNLAERVHTLFEGAVHQQRARTTNGYSLALVPPKSEEFARVTAHFVHTLVGAGNGGTVRLRSLHRVYNHKVWGAYLESLKSVHSRDRGENLMFHGCRSARNEDNILAKGFLVSRCVSGGTNYGTWLAFNAAYSDAGFVYRRDSKHASIFICFVHRKQVAMLNDTMMVVGQDAAYPAYLLEYRRG